MTQRTESDFKANLVDLSKIPANEFERHFHEWMERDDVARGLQAKLRCDLIKNFNKTNLGKHIISHTMSSSGGSSTRLTLSPLILALNTLVAEFLYAQNCHFTLSVFCTEIPFRNTLPDFESQRNFRFNMAEIAEIWEAITGSVANKKDLNKHVIQNYETNPNLSLLLLIVKCLLEQKPVELLRKSVEIQTETQHTTQRTTSVQASEVEQKSPTKDVSLHPTNKQLLALSEKVNEMIKEFEQFTKHRNLPRPIRSVRSSHSRDYMALNKSLERITDNMKHISLAKRKSKRFSNIVESIDNLTKEFGKCAQHFDKVTKVLNTSESKSPVKMQKPKKLSCKEKQTETDVQEKSYADWIQEMRTTTNGQKFLDRVEISLRKALKKHREQLQNETDMKIKHLKSVMKLHYQQKLSKHLLQQDSKASSEDNRKLNKKVEMKLQQFEMKQLELMKQLQESSNELREAQRKQREQKFGREVEKKLPFKENVLEVDSPQWRTETEQKQQQNLQVFTNMPNVCLIDASDTQKQIKDMVQTIAEQGHAVDHIIYDAKLRMQQLESESNQLEENFQSYLKRRKQEQQKEQQELKQNYEMQLMKPKESSQVLPLSKVGIQSTDLDFIMTEKGKFIFQNFQSKFYNEEEEENEEEFQYLMAKLHESEKKLEQPLSARSNGTTSSLELKNAILEAKLKFFEHESTLRRSKEQELEIHSGNLLQKHLEKHHEKFEPYYYNQNFGQKASDAFINVQLSTENKEIIEFNIESSLSEINIKDKTLDEEHEIDVSPMTDKISEKIQEHKVTTSLKRELFPSSLKSLDSATAQPAASEIDSRHTGRCHESIVLDGNDIRQALEELKSYSENMENKEAQQTEATSQLLKQSMAKMQQLFQEKPNGTTEMKQPTETSPTDTKVDSTLKLTENVDNFDKSQSTMTTSTTGTTNTTTATNTTLTKEERFLKNQTEMLKTVEYLNRISKTSIPSALGVSSESEESLKSTTKKMDLTKEIPKTDQSAQIFGIEEQYNESDESGQSSEYKLLPTSGFNNGRKDLHLEIEQDNTSSEFSQLNALPPSGNEMEIGEILSESYQKFTNIEIELSDSSAQTSSVLEISTGPQSKHIEKLSDDGESDFWA